ncbi:MAG: argininosuccinate lyase, partial [Candidatus Rokubacteria bacterium]|nr:argininosuccinate lyase [Candidatus Rokubacteria bacterium]
MTAPDPKSPWGGRFTEPADTSARAFTASLSFDHRLWPQDLQGSEAWARALAKGGVLSETELDTILRGLAEVRRELETGAFPYRIELEDIHMNIERRLIEKIGAVGGKLHTGRSRNDQIALDMRLWLRGEIDAIRAALREVQAALVEQAERHPDCPMPGYTHLQRAQPVLLAHHLLAYVFMFGRDRERLADARRRLDVCPLGAGALAGTTVPIDRQALAQALGFRAAAANSMDAVSDRDFAIELISALAILGMHLSRL